MTMQHPILRSVDIRKLADEQVAKGNSVEIDIVSGIMRITPPAPASGENELDLIQFARKIR